MKDITLHFSGDLQLSRSKVLDICINEFRNWLLACSYGRLAGSLLQRSCLGLFDFLHAGAVQQVASQMV